jgi:hypothetical protein
MDDDYNLPATYGKSRLVLLAVDPYLIHAYWEITQEDLVEAKKQTGPAREVLRFYKTGKKAGNDKFNGFDIEIDIQSRTWYVHLWSAEESYRADLGLRRDDGTLVPIVRSPEIRMPRSRPVTVIDQHFMKVEPAERRAEIVPPPSIEHRPPQKIPVPYVQEMARQTPPPGIVDTGQSVKEKIESVYAPLEWPGWRFHPESAAVIGGAPAPPEIASASTEPPTSNQHERMDLAAMAEKELSPGSSSVSLPKVRPDIAADEKK